MFSNKNNAWSTPRSFFNEINKEFNFTLDPCCTEKSATCSKYFTPETDGLIQSWENERCFVNPPYGRQIGKWVKKCFDERNNAELIVMLIPSRTDTSYFHNWIYGFAEIRFIRGRLKFVDLDVPEEERKLSPAPFPSMLVIFRKEKLTNEI